MGFKVKIFSVGKPSKEPWLEEGIAEYTKRLKNSLTIEWVWAKDDAQLVAMLKGTTAAICLDPQGKAMSSEQFSTFLLSQLQAEGSRLSFVIGGADGLPQSLRQHYPLISLSPMTFTHQLTRLVLMEQIYRALEISKGSPYHK